MSDYINTIIDYINPIIKQIVSIWLYIVFSLSEKFGITARMVEYIIVFAILFFISLFLLHKIYRFFVSSALKQKANFFLVCDTILYTVQSQNIGDSQDNVLWIQDILKKGSYEKSYNDFLEKSSIPQLEQLNEKLKKSHKMYINASRRKKICGLFLSFISLGLYYLFLEN